MCSGVFPLVQGSVLSWIQSDLSPYGKLWTPRAQLGETPQTPIAMSLPSYQRPALHPLDDVDTLFPAFQRGRPFFEDGEDAVLSSGYSSQNSEQ